MALLYMCGISKESSHYNIKIEEKRRYEAKVVSKSTIERAILF